MKVNAIMYYECFVKDSANWVKIAETDTMMHAAKLAAGIGCASQTQLWDTAKFGVRHKFTLQPVGANDLKKEAKQ